MSVQCLPCLLASSTGVKAFKDHPQAHQSNASCDSSTRLGGRAALTHHGRVDCDNRHTFHVRRRQRQGNASVSAKASTGEGVIFPASSLRALSATVANLFPVWLVLAALLALWKPSLFLWFQKDYVTGGLALTMLSMGTSLTIDDFTGVMKRPGQVALGATLQYTIMPMMGFLVSRLAGLSPPLAVGLCLVASCPGGVASNVVTFLAKADVPLSVLMTSVSTMAAVVTTPLLVKLLVGSIVPVNAAALVSSTVQVVLLPVGFGAFLNQSFPKQMEKTAPFAPLLAVSMTVLICASVLAQNATAVKQASLGLVGAVFTLHAGGFLLGYLLARAFGAKERQARTMSIEVGMQNSTLGAVLAAVHFKDPTTAVPCAISACMHSLLGSALAAYFRQKAPDSGDEGQVGANQLA